jgi:hypothetical protein
MCMWPQVVAFLDGVKLPEVNPDLDSLQASNSTTSGSGMADRPTATSAPLPMLNLTTTSRKRLGLVFQNKKGKKRKQQLEEDEQGEMSCQGMHVACVTSAHWVIVTCRHTT